MNWGADLRALLMRYRNSRIRDFELQTPDPEELAAPTESEIRADLEGKSINRFLDFFTRRGLTRLAIELGLIDSFRQRGFKPVLKLVAIDPPHQMLRIYDRTTDPEHLLVEIAAHREITVPREGSELPPGEYHFLVVDWMLLQNPGAPFSHHRPKLPGQNHPGLRMGRELGEMIILTAERLKLDGMITFPNHFHNGVLYSRKLQFVNPRFAGEMKALERDLASLTLAERSWAIELGCVTLEDGSPYKWPAPEMICPLKPELRDHLGGESYLSRADRAFHGSAFKLDLETFTRRYEPL